MDISEISQGLVGLNAARLKIDHDDERNKEIAKEFEGMFVRHLMNKMKDTIPEDEEEDSSTKQIKGMFWSFLGDEVAKQGGFGMWESIYESMPKKGAGQSADPKLNESA
jgi:Rod binding domain-containing protein